MDPMTASILGVIFVVIGFAALLLMMELRGNPTEKAGMKNLIRFHRIFGYLFTVIFVFMLVAMISRTDGIPSEFSPRVILHIVFALSLGVILGLKILAVRRYKRLVHWIMGFGVIIFLLAFLLNAITAGYFLLQPRVSSGGGDNGGDIGTEYRNGKEVVQQKCTLCHNLDRVKKADKNEEMWFATIDRMAEYYTKGDLLSQSEKEALIKFLIQKR